jgi:hypothetical protein
MLFIRYPSITRLLCEDQTTKTDLDSAQDTVIDLVRDMALLRPVIAQYWATENVTGNNGSWGSRGRRGLGAMVRNLTPAD